MSVRGQRTAFISIGLSCQPALQLYRNREHLASLVGEPLDYSSSFFNWLMLSADEIPRLMERMTAPIEASSIGLPAGVKVPVLVGYRAWLFHDGPNTKITRKKHRLLVAKYEHLRQNFLDLCSRPTRHFVLSNAQNNLAVVHPHLSDDMTITFDDALIATIKATVDRLFPAGENHLLVVGRSDRLEQPMGCPVRVPPADDTMWHGDTAAWAHVLEDHVRSLQGVQEAAQTVTRPAPVRDRSGQSLRPHSERVGRGNRGLPAEGSVFASTECWQAAGTARPEEWHDLRHQDVFSWFHRFFGLEKARSKQPHAAVCCRCGGGHPRWWCSGLFPKQFEGHFNG